MEKCKLSGTYRDGLFLGFCLSLHKRVNQIFSLLAFRQRHIHVDYTARIGGIHYMRIGRGFRAGRQAWLEVIEPDKMRKQPCLIIGENVTLTEYDHIGCANYIEIGNNVLFGSKVYVTDHNHGSYQGIMHSSPQEKPVERILECDQSVIIKDNAWLGDNVVVLPGVTIGYGAVIGAGAVVTHDVPDRCIAVGVPARVLKIWDPEGKKWKANT